MCDCKNCQCDSGSDSSGFIFGIILGAIIGAVIAVLIYKNNQTEVFSDLKTKLEKYFSSFTKTTTPSRKKISVELPPKVVKTAASSASPKNSQAPSVP